MLHRAQAVDGPFGAAPGVADNRRLRRLHLFRHDAAKPATLIVADRTSHLVAQK
jgi:hypothetical protein